VKLVENLFSGDMENELQQLSLEPNEPQLKEKISEEFVEVCSEFLLQCRFNEFDDAKQTLEACTPDNLVAFIDEHGNTCLHMAAGNGHTELLSHLLTFNPTIDIQNKEGSTPLHWYQALTQGMH
jgi:ankyrin repeat protein